MHQLHRLILVFLLVGLWAHLSGESVQQDKTAFTIAIYFAPKPTTDPDAALKTLLENKFASLRADDSKLKVTAVWADLADSPLPSSKAFHYFAQDVSAEQETLLRQSARCFGLIFQATGNLQTANHRACELVDALAQVTGGYPWDDECRLIYSANSWHQRRVETWQNDIPDVRSEITMHAYRDSELIRVITLGMRKFGLPDLVIDELPDSGSRSAGNTINACAQLMLEGKTPVAARMNLRLSDIRHSSMRESALKNPGKGAKGEVTVRLRNTPREEGDPENRLWKLEFPDAAGTSTTERALDGFSTLFGSTDQIFQPKNAEAIRAASEKARAAFFASAATYRKGMAPNERLMIKKGFPVSNGHEYMWVEVIGWKENAIEGILANDSYYDKSLRVGKRVVVSFDDIYDYIHYKPDGTEEGNETSKFLENQ